MLSDEPRLLILGAHPDDAEYHAGGLASIYRQLGRTVKMVSVTDGGAGHHERSRDELIPLRRNEAAAAGRVIGASYETWDFPDGALQVSLDVRHRIIREIREFKPDLVLTHRTSDYHPDHRAVGQCVQDASYLVKVPHVVPDVPALRRDPVVAYMPDMFTKPLAMQPQVVVNVGEFMQNIVAMLACHESQVFEWLAYEGDLLADVPADQTGKIAWLHDWFANQIRPRSDHFRKEIVAAYGNDAGESVEYIEAFEISEYAHVPDGTLIDELFPNCRQV
jgi:LmbE family N-acetylglucosaminyl deacetylase